jgi:flavin reductase (DIM6/NTAB) family NADH-FMN oxidoreductase RutF
LISKGRLVRAVDVVDVDIIDVEVVEVEVNDDGMDE